MKVLTINEYMNLLSLDSLMKTLLTNMFITIIYATECELRKRTYKDDSESMQGEAATSIEKQQQVICMIGPDSLEISDRQTINKELSITDSWQRPDRLAKLNESPTNTRQLVERKTNTVIKEITSRNEPILWWDIDGFIHSSNLPQPTVRIWP